MKLSNHSKKRLKERTGLEERAQRELFKSALNKGLSLQKAMCEEYDCNVISFLKKKSRNGKVGMKIYKGFVFIHSKNAKQLFTVYKCPKNVWDSIKRRNK